MSLKELFIIININIIFEFVWMLWSSEGEYLKQFAWDLSRGAGLNLACIYVYFTNIAQDLSHYLSM